MKTYIKWLLGLYLLLAYPAWGTVETSKPASTSDDWGGPTNANVSYNGLWVGAPDSTEGGAGTSIYLGWDNTRYYAHAVRFPSIDIPQGATIDSAELWVRSGCNACTDSLILLASILDADNGVQVVDTDDFRLNFGLRATGSGDIDTGYVATTTSWALNAYVRLPFNKLDSVIQNNISRAGWTSGNSITMFVTSRGGTLTSTLRRATRHFSYSSGSQYDSLWISYTHTPGGDGGGTPNTIIRSATVRSVILRAPEKMFYRRETWKW